MSVGSNLQEMENVVTKGAAAAEPMKKLTTGIPDGQTGSWEDLGGPTPENYKADDNSAKLAEPKIATVKDIVNRGAGKADPMPKGMKEEEEVEGEVVEEEETTASAEEVVSEEESTEEAEVVAEEEEAPEAEYNIEEDVEALLAGEELSEEFQEKARTIFETAIKTKVAEIKEELSAKYDQTLEEQVVSIKEELTDRVDAYLEYVAEEWLTENQLAVEHGLKTEMTESFLTGMKSLFEEHYVTIPEEKYDVLESMVEKLDDMETKLNEQIEKNISLNKRLSESVADGIFESISEGLAATQKDKLASLVESVEFESEDQYREKLETLKEAYFAKKASSTAKTETLSEGVSNGHESYSPSMAAYLRTLGSTSK